MTDRVRAGDCDREMDLSSAWLYDIVREKVSSEHAPTSLNVAMRAIGDEVVGTVLDALRSAPVERRMALMLMQEVNRQHEPFLTRRYWEVADAD